METRRILNLDIQSVGFDEFVATLDHGVVFTPNVDHLVRLQRDPAFAAAYRAADHVVCDSRLVQFASRFLHPGHGIVAQLAGSDLLPALCRHHAHRPDGLRVYLLGGTPGSVLAARLAANRDASGEVVVGGCSPPFGFESDAAETGRIVDAVNASGATVLAVGVGSPKQELWIQANRGRMPGVRVFIGVGATIDFMAGAVPRAPAWMTRFGLEWLYRLSREPRRLARRYLLDDPRFFWLVLKQKLGWYRDPFA